MIVRTLVEAKLAASTIRYPILVVPAFTLNGRGKGIAFDDVSFSALVTAALNASLTREVLLKKPDDEVENGLG